MIKNLLFVFAALIFASTYAQQTLRPSEMVELANAKYKAEHFNLFTREISNTKTISKVLHDFSEVSINHLELNRLKNSDAKLFEIEVPMSNNESITLQLVRTDIFNDNSYVKTYPSEKLVDVEVGSHFRGIIKGDNKTVVSFSAFKKEVMGLASGLYGSNLVIGKVKDTNSHVVYLDEQIAKHQKFECAVPDDNVSYTEDELTYTTETNREGPQCVRFYIEVNTDIYNSRGSTTSTSNFVTGFMNQVMTLYANENINTKLMPLAIWTQTSPYTGTSTSQLLSQFQNTRTSWDGDLGQLLAFKGGGGVAAGFAGICNSNRRNSMSYSGIYNYYSSVPTFSWTVQVVTHEFGHTFGSRHTHACVWNGNGTAIDGCSGYTEGSCALPGYPSGGGTIMSYCHTQNTGINLAKGFGTQPGNVIRNRVNYGSCLQDCSGDVDPTPSECEYNTVTVNLTTDNYASETSWTIEDENGSVVASGDNYTSNNTSYTIDNCLEDGCYTFKIKDTYGDGICCSYGNGSYSVIYNGEEVAAGGDFDSLDSTDFCVTNETPTPSCSDITVSFKTDNYPKEISWDLKDSNNQIIGSGSDFDQSNELYTVEGCVAPGCYTLTFYDTYGDGFCCSYGNGKYEFYEGSTLKLSEFANFQRSVSHSICVGNESTQMNNLVLSKEIPPFTTTFDVLSPFKEEFKLKFDDLKKEILIDNVSIRNIDGRIVYTTKNLSTKRGLAVNSATWDKGIYILTVELGNQIETVKIIKK